MKCLICGCEDIDIISTTNFKNVICCNLCNNFDSINEFPKIHYINNQYIIALDEINKTFYNHIKVLHTLRFILKDKFKFSVNFKTLSIEELWDIYLRYPSIFKFNTHYFSKTVNKDYPEVCARTYKSVINDHTGCINFDIKYQVSEPCGLIVKLN